MRLIAAFTSGLILMLYSIVSYAGCPEGELSLSFSNLQIKMAFAIIADYAGLKPNIDQSIDQSSPINIECTPWQDAAIELAREHHITLKIENGVMYVSK